MKKRECRVYFAQHVVLLHVVDLSGVYLSLQRVLKELPADVQQDGADRPLLQWAAGGGLVVVAGGRDAVPQDHPHQQTWGEIIQKMLYEMCSLVNSRPAAHLGKGVKW